jgi:enoyl-[acyl-carrier-protein] reductase (NADH)
MNNENLIPVEQLCKTYEVDFTFVQALSENDLLKIITIEEKSFISEADVASLEKMMRLHFDLGINLEGLDAVVHLLNKLNSLQDELIHLKNKT